MNLYSYPHMHINSNKLGQPFINWSLRGIDFKKVQFTGCLNTHKSQFLKPPYFQNRLRINPKWFWDKDNFQRLSKAARLRPLPGIHGPQLILRPFEIFGQTYKRSEQSMDPSSASMSNKLLLLTGGQADKIEGEYINIYNGPLSMDHIILPILYGPYNTTTRQFLIRTWLNEDYLDRFRESRTEIPTFFTGDAFINLFATQMSTKWQNKKNLIIFDNLFSIWGAQWIYFGTWCHKKLVSTFTKASIKTLSLSKSNHFHQKFTI